MAPIPRPAPCNPERAEQTPGTIGAVKFVAASYKSSQECLFVTALKKSLNQHRRADGPYYDKQEHDVRILHCCHRAVICDGLQSLLEGYHYPHLRICICWEDSQSINRRRSDSLRGSAEHQSFVRQSLLAGTHFPGHREQALIQPVARGG